MPSFLETAGFPIKVRMCCVPIDIGYIPVIIQERLGELTPAVVYTLWNC